MLAAMCKHLDTTISWMMMTAPRDAYTSLENSTLESSQLQLQVVNGRLPPKSAGVLGRKQKITDARFSPEMDANTCSSSSSRSTRRDRGGSRLLLRTCLETPLIVRAPIQNQAACIEAQPSIREAWLYVKHGWCPDT